MRFRGFDLSTKNLGQGVKQVVQKSHTDLSARMEEIYEKRAVKDLEMPR